MGLIDKVRDFFYYSAEEEAARVPSEWKKRRRWNNVPMYSTDEALAILVKSGLTEVRVMADNAAQYAAGSIIQRNTAFYINVMMAMLKNAMGGYGRLSDTPLGDRILLDTLDLVREQYQLVLEEIGGG